MKSSHRDARILSFHLGGHGHQREPTFPAASGKDGDGSGGGGGRGGSDDGDGDDDDDYDDDDDNSSYGFSNFVPGIVLKAFLQ